MAQTFPLFVGITALDKFTAPIGRMSGALEGFGKKATKLGKKLTLGLTLPTVAFGAKAITTGLDYQRSLNRVEAITGATSAELEKLAASAEGALGKQGIPVTARRSAAAMFELAHSGQSVADMQSSLAPVLALATAAQTDQAEAAQISADVLDAYGLAASEAARVTDVLAFASNKGQSELGDIGAAAISAGATARAWRQDLEGTVAVIDVLTDSVGDSSLAAQLWKRALVALQNPTGQVASTLKRLGVTSGEIFTEDGNLRQFDEILRTLAEHGATAKDSVLLFGKKAGPGLATLLGPGAERAGNFATELRGAGGSAERLAKVQLKGGVGALEVFDQKWEKLLITVAQSGLLEAFTSLTEQFGALLQKVSELSPGTLKFGIAVAAVGAVLGPALVGLGGLATALGFILPILGPIALAFGAFLISPLGLVTVAIGAVVAAGVYLVTHWEEVKKKTAEVWGAVTRIVGNALEWVGEKVSALAGIMPDWLLDLLGVGPAGGVAGVQHRGVGRPAVGREVGAARIGRTLEERGLSRATRAGGRLEVHFKNAPPGLRVRSTQTGDVPVDVETGYNLAGGLAG